MVNTLSNSFVSRTYPISGINYTGSIIAEFGGDLRRDGSGSCGAGWEALLDMLRTLRPAPSDGVNRDVVLGLLPGGVAAQQIPRNKFTGCGGYDGVAVTFAGYDYDRAVAHELGHAYGRMHAPCANPDTNNVDPMYPTYGGTFPAGSIGEWGFGTTFSTLINPATIFDFMSYCHDQWISPYTYVGLFLSILFRNIGWGLSPSAGAPAALLEASEERDYLCLNFRMYRDGRVEVLPSFHLSGVGPVPGSEDGPQPPVVFELRDAEERVIGFHRCHFTDPNSDPDSPYRAFHEVIPWESETRSIRFLRDGEEVDKVDVEERAPELTSQAVTELEDPGNRRRLEWEGNHDTESLTYLVRYSNDGGENWLGLAAGLTEPRFVADLDCLPGGETCVFQIVASSTIRTTVAETDPVPVPIKPRRPFIVSPEPDASFLQGESVVLAGLGYSPDFGTAPLDEVVWTSNVAGFIGYGYEVITQTLTPGLHKITLGVTDGIGAEASEDVLIRINPKEE